MKISRTDLFVPPRQRSEIPRGPLEELRDSILGPSGLMHAPCVRFALPDDGTTCPYVLVSGERRLRAIELIATSNKHFIYDGEVYFPGELPVTTLTHSEAADYLSAELEENIVRQDLSWTDRVRAVAKIHSLRLAAQGPTHSTSDTAKELAAKGDGRAPDSVRVEIDRAIIIQRHLSDPLIARARSAKDAMALITRKEEQRYASELIQRRNNASASNGMGPDGNSIDLRLGDATTILPLFPPGTFDLVLTDPPYGISADSAGFRQKSGVGGHQYSDSADTARRLISLAISEGYRLSRDRANLFMFLDIDLFHFARELCDRTGWATFRTPLHWVKSESEGLAPWGGQGPRRTVEWLLYATKGQRGLITSPLDVLRFSRVSRTDRLHAAEKPLDLLQYLIECSTLPGDSILDPFAGSGATLEAARNTRRRATGVELSTDAYHAALARLGSPSASPPSAPIIGGLYTAQDDSL